MQAMTGPRRAAAPKSAAPDINFPFPDSQRGVSPYHFPSIICKQYYQQLPIIEYISFSEIMILMAI